MSTRTHQWALAVGVAFALVPAVSTADARPHRISAKDGLWGAKNKPGTESFGFKVGRHGRRILNFNGGLSPAARPACFGVTEFRRIRVSRTGRFHASYTTTSGTQTIKIRGSFRTRRRAVFYVRRIERPPGLPPCDSGPVRFTARFII